MTLAALLLPAALAGSVTVPVGAAAEAFAPRRVALLVGVEQYADPALQGLRFAAKDARDLGAVLASPDLGGFDRVTVVEGAASTSRDALRRAIAVATADLQRDDTFVLYLSGHGTLTLDPIDGSRLWFLPADARLDEPERTGLAVDEVESLVNGLPARRRVLILDTCHNGRTGSKSSLSPTTARQLQGLRGEPPAPRGEREVSESEARLFAAQYYQPAMEDPALQNGVYTHFLLDALTSARGIADLDRDQLVDVTEAHEYARDRTIAYTGGLQIPRAEYRIVGREEIYLSGRATQRSSAEQALVSAYDRVLERARLLVDGVPRGELPGLYAVEPGAQTLEIRTEDGRTLARRRVRLAPGARLALEDLVRGPGPALHVLGGASWTGGTDLVLPVAASAQVAWVHPFPLPERLRPDLHLTLDLAAGVLPSGIPATSGALALGATLGFTFGPVWIGPGADLRVPFRVHGDTDAAEGGLSAAGLLAFGGDVPVATHLALSVRAEATVAPLAAADGTTDLTYGGAARVGLRFGR